jgi:hypothetical protein
MLGFDRIIENKIQEAIKNGEFDDLPGKGKPLDFEDLSQVPEDLRMGFKVLKNAGLLPEEMQLKKEIYNLEQLIATTGINENMDAAKAKLVDKVLRYKMMMEKKGKRVP